VQEKSDLVNERNIIAEKIISELLQSIDALKKERKEMKNSYFKIKTGMKSLFEINTGKQEAERNVDH
ncbi:hypothetical protein THOM_0393, partial [Trachipleistophora hominis]